MGIISSDDEGYKIEKKS